MLKRRRSSPSFVPDSPYAAAPEPTIDVFERVVKRRRQVTPQDHFAVYGKGAQYTDDTDGEEDIEGDKRDGGQSHYPQGSDRLEQAGEYRSANTLLHDLHAEHRHRMLFFLPRLPSDVSTPQCHLYNEYHHHHHHHSTSTTDKTLPAPVDAEPPSAALHKHTPSFTISIPSKDANTVDHVEVQRVTQRYEDTNRYLGSLFLSRRKHPDTPELSSQT
ncbi:hypothetical protein C8Q79DRAFT_1004918 [Trametes meyenii]|nr:hypothetical protein C8Q79DRAFT_1004918 [Trametes meyenii]